MPCDGCPEYASNPQGTATIVHAGGPAYRIFANVIHVLSEDDKKIITKWGKPKIHPKGEIEYQQNEAEPPEIEGYQRDASNSRLLRPIWPHCNWRCLHVWRIDDGQVKIVAGCLTPASNLPSSKTLSLAFCQNCLNLNSLPERLVAPDHP